MIGQWKETIDKGRVGCELLGRLMRGEFLMGHAVPWRSHDDLAGFCGSSYEVYGKKTLPTQNT